MSDGLSSERATSDRLESWKEIAAYLKRGVSTVQRWEHEEGLPVHRHHHQKAGSVYGFRAEIDAWWDARRLALTVREAENPSLPEGPEECPYPGLSSFTERNAAYFFGREQEVQALWDKLRARRRLLAVIGSSGVGKTSLVRAGLVPARPEGWAARVCTPGAAPFRNLGRALAQDLSGDRESLALLVDIDDPAVAYSVVDHWRDAHGEALLIVDQFEELFTLNAGPVQQQFAWLIGRLAEEAGVCVLLSLRDDFLIRCSEHVALAPLFRDLTPLPALDRDGLVRALVEPARQKGYAFDDEALVGEMIDSVEGTRGALPLLAFAVARLWEMRDRARRLLTRSAYESVGGVAGALAQHAEGTLEQIGAVRHDVVRDLFRTLVTSQGTRAVAEREDLLSAFADRRAAEEVLRRLIDARLLTSFELDGVDGQRPRHRVELVHESLLHAWPRLARWQAQDAEGAVLRDQLKQAAHLWDEKGRTNDLLWTGTASREFELWREHYPGALTAVEEDFARAMRGRARRRKRLRRLAAGAIAAAAVLVAAVTGTLWRRSEAARGVALDEASHAEASRLVALGRLELDTDPTVALAYARKSLEVHDGSEARRLALEALWRGPVASVIPVQGGDNDICQLVWPSPDGEWLACSNWGGVITLFSADGRRVRRLSNNPHSGRMRVVRFSQDSRRLATFAEFDPETVVWSFEGQAIARFRPGGFPRRFAGDELDLQLLPRPDRPDVEIVTRRLGGGDVRLLARVGSQGGLTWPAWPRESTFDAYIEAVPAALEALRTARAEPDTFAGYSDESDHLLLVDSQHHVRIWSIVTNRLVREIEGLDPDRFFRAPVISAGGTLLAWQSLRQRAYPIWDLAGPPVAEPLLLHKGEVAGEQGGAAFTVDGRWLITALRSKVAFWPLAQAWPQLIRTDGISVSAVAFTPDARQIVSCTPDGTWVYPTTPDAPPGFRVDGASWCYDVAVERSGAHALIGGPGVAGLWAPLEGRTPQTLFGWEGGGGGNFVAVDPAGRWLATARAWSTDPAERVLRLMDRRTGLERRVLMEGATRDDPESGGIVAMRFAGDGTLISVGRRGLQRWNPGTGARQVLEPTTCRHIDTTSDGRRLLVACEQAGTPVGTGVHGPQQVFILDLQTGVRRPITSHGTDVQSLAISPSGDAIATGDSTGVVRVGRADGSEPHLLVESSGEVRAVTFSPNSRWVASASGNEIRLWPMPDLTKPPLHTLPREALIAKLRSLTNVRVVDDATASTGYKVDLAPFPGWKRVPSW